MSRRLTISCILALMGVIFFGDAVRIYAKGVVGQALLQRAWDRTLRGEREVKPWRWADTVPLAKLEFPRLGYGYIVLAGASGRTLAWGPGHVDGTALPGQKGNCVISAHRDTQFSMLRDVRIGDVITLQTPAGRVIRYRVTARRIATDRDTFLLAPTTQQELTLITCYPFDAVRPGTHQRYVVMATARAGAETK